MASLCCSAWYCWVVLLSSPQALNIFFKCMCWLLLGWRFKGCSLQISRGFSVALSSPFGALTILSTMSSQLRDRAELCHLNSGTVLNSVRSPSLPYSEKLSPGNKFITSEMIGKLLISRLWATIGFTYLVSPVSGINVLLNLLFSDWNCYFINLAFVFKVRG